MVLVRNIGGVILGVVALVVFFAMAPEGSFEDDVSRDSVVDSVMSEDSLNSATTDSAPQQQVVNGWTSRDLLEIIAREQVAPPEQDERPAALLLLGALGVALHLATSRPREGKSRQVAARVPVPQQGPVPDPAFQSMFDERP